VVLSPVVEEEEEAAVGLGEVSEELLDEVEEVISAVSDAEATAEEVIEVAVVEDWEEVAEEEELWPEVKLGAL
jgi:hypothetical protein